MCLGGCEPWYEVSGEAEWMDHPSLTNMSTMTWQQSWVARGDQRGSEAWAGGDGVVWRVVEAVVADGGAGGVVLSSTRHVRVNASVRSRVTPFSGLQTIVVGCCLLWYLSLRS
jgi:hypothetical protein